MQSKLDPTVRELAVVEDEGKKEEQKFEFDSAGEVVGYISLDQAVVLAMQTADDEPGNYGRRYRDARMVFEAVQQSENEDFYNITLSFRPEGAFVGTAGQEQFFIAKEGTVARRQVRFLPREQRLPFVDHYGLKRSVGQPQRSLPGVQAGQPAVPCISFPRVRPRWFQSWGWTGGAGHERVHTSHHKRHKRHHR